MNELEIAEEDLELNVAVLSLMIAVAGDYPELGVQVEAVKSLKKKMTSFLVGVQSSGVTEQLDIGNNALH